MWLEGVHFPMCNRRVARLIAEYEATRHDKDENEPDLEERETDGTVDRDRPRPRAGTLSTLCSFVKLR